MPLPSAGKKLLDIMDDFRIKLAEQVNKFTTQALEVDERDRQLIQQRDRALKLNETTLRLKQNATALNAELELILCRRGSTERARRPRLARGHGVPPFAPPRHGPRPGVPAPGGRAGGCRSAAAEVAPHFYHR